LGGRGRGEEAGSGVGDRRRRQLSLL